MEKNKVVNGCGPFGMSILFVILTGKQPEFTYCCDEHDLFYEEGGTNEDKKFADDLLVNCVDKSGHPYVAKTFGFILKYLGWICYKYTK